MKITKCTTIGPPRIGKTCLKHLLTEQEWDVEAGTASTDVMEAPEWVECYSVEEGGAEKPWKLLTAEQQQGELIRAVNTLNTGNTNTPSDAPPTTTSSDVQHPTTPSDLQHPTTPSDLQHPTTPGDLQHPTTPSDLQHPTTPSDLQHPTTPSDLQHPTTPNDAPPTTTPSNAQHPTSPSDAHFRTTPSSAPPPSTKPDAAQKLATVWQALEALASACSRESLQDFLKDKEGKVLGETRLVHFIDTGGQAIYHDVHPVLITSPSVYLVVFSLKELYEKKDRKEQLNYFRSDLIQRPLRSIYTFGMKTLHNKEYVVLHSEAPKILIVGTHLDQIRLEDSGGTQEDFLSDISKMIRQEIGNKPYRQFVQCDPKDRSFWAVDNTQAGKEQDPDAKEYSTALRMMVQEGSTEMSVKVPLPWMLLKVVMDSKGEHYCKYSELLKEARIRGYVREHSPSEDLDTMLWLFHILGLFYHKVPKGYKKEDSLVFIDPDCLYSATSDFLMAAKEEIGDSKGGSEERRHQTHAATREETEDSQGGSEEGQHQTQAATREETEDNQGGSEEGQHQTQAATREETEDNQGGSEEGQHPTQAATREETEDNQGGSEEGQHQTQAATREETEDNQGGSEEGQHQTQAATMEETEDTQGGSGERLHQTQAATGEKTEDNQGGSEEGQDQTQATTIEEMCHDKEMAGKGSKLEADPIGIVCKKRVIKRIQNNSASIQHEMEAVLQNVENTMTQEGIKAVLESLHDQLKKKIERWNKVFPRESRDASSVKAKRQLFIVRLVHSLASSVEAVLRDSGRKGDVHKAVVNIRMWYQSRSIHSNDMDQFLAILSDLRIVAQLSDPDSYVVPAALPKVHHLAEIAGNADPVLVTVVSKTIMRVCYLPSGLFCCLISELVTGLSWTVIPLGRTHVAFTHENFIGKVHLIEHESYIEIKLESEVSLKELAHTCQTVQRSVHGSIVSVYKNLYSDPTAGTTFEESLVWGFQCEEHPDDDTHIAAFEEDEYECCAECLLPDSNALQPVTEAQRVWGLMTT